MSESKISRSLFPQFTEEQLEEEPYEVTLTEMENIEMEVALTIVSGRQLEQPGKKAIETLHQQEPRNKGEYCSKNSGSDTIPNTVTVHEPNASRLAEGRHPQ
ncbi:hypothetical protein GLOIN_2v1470193 [Rhizophagus irregularis DAOM 181602=DAOM 197198]|uniref:Uncharacterized protein n=1 Tax=Rhizophagus irregularis (strain DAOM 181602 / DAOM 197198 / MUCL 43194) TaxID=747089 RepID=A0A2P4QX72_RHIID|nr:hypothetical protein GLOIN_2v1470193 [Rhizophagus irregularis DAOM 181602=DAOM 197198]POG82229.1 hypothetical protein GLOIN_2v1470193 [Rhizophagus irregularis DAOM 181602=DAOM 197198]|eukprot:XP_025189095.1 hypothetical protein GLOIN_2v1470193 [Rhizophagus irregularis DAOM 181602=DAOM 197198]